MVIEEGRKFITIWEIEKICEICMIDRYGNKYGAVFFKDTKIGYFNTNKGGVETEKTNMDKQSFLECLNKHNMNYIDIR